MLIFNHHTKNIEFFTKWTFIPNLLKSLPKILNFLPKITKIFTKHLCFTKDIEKNTKFNFEKIPNILKILPTINYFFLPIIFIFLPKNTEFFYQTQKLFYWLHSSPRNILRLSGGSLASHIVLTACIGRQLPGKRSHKVDIILR